MVAAGAAKVTATGIVTGLEREAQGLRSLPVGEHLTVACFGPGPAAAARAAASLLAQGCGALASCGFAGGLDPALRPGDVVVAEAVVAADGSAFATDSNWRQAMLSRLRRLAPRRRCAGGRIAGLGQPLLTAADKAECANRLSACAVDMESAAVGKAAAAAGVPLLVVRVILDPADRPIPAWLAGTLGASGKPLPSRLLAGLATHPGDLPALLRLAGDERRALAALRGVVLDAGPRLARP